MRLRQVPIHNGYRCMLTGCLGQNNAGPLIDNLRNYEQRIKNNTVDKTALIDV